MAWGLARTMMGDGWARDEKTCGQTVSTPTWQLQEARERKEPMQSRRDTIEATPFQALLLHLRKQMEQAHYCRVPRRRRAWAARKGKCPTPVRVSQSRRAIPDVPETGRACRRISADWPSVRTAGPGQTARRLSVLALPPGFLGREEPRSLGTLPIVNRARQSPRRPVRSSLVRQVRSTCSDQLLFLLLLRHRRRRRGRRASLVKRRRVQSSRVGGRAPHGDAAEE